MAAVGQDTGVTRVDISVTRAETGVTRVDTGVTRVDTGDPGGTGELGGLLQEVSGCLCCAGQELARPYGIMPL